MKRRTRKRLWLALLVVGVLLLGAAAALFWYSRPARLPTFDFLTGHQPHHERNQRTAGWWGSHREAVYRLSGRRDDVAAAARRELIPLGYAERPRPISAGVAEGTPNAPGRSIPVTFHKQQGRTAIHVFIVQGRFVQALPDGNFSISGNLEDVNVQVLQYRTGFAPHRHFQNWWNNRTRKSTPPPPPGSPSQP